MGATLISPKETSNEKETSFIKLSIFIAGNELVLAPVEKFILTVWIVTTRTVYGTGGHAFIARMNTPELAAALFALGCPSQKSGEMAAQLEKRARQLAKQKGRSYEETMAHLLQLMQRGWAAQDRGA